MTTLPPDLMIKSVDDPTILTRPSRTYYRRGWVFVTGERIWIGGTGDPDSLGVRRVIDARGVVWERRAGWWRRYDQDDRSFFTWRPLVDRFGPLVEIVRISRGIDGSGGES